MIKIYRHPADCCKLVFSWDIEKEAKNRNRKGRRDFEFASYVFHDTTVLTDYNSSKDGEDREETLGKILHTIYFVVHTIKVLNNVETIRITAKRQRVKGLPIPNAIKLEAARLALIPDSEIDMTDMPEKLDWSNAVVGKYYRPMKEPVSLRMDADVLNWFRSGGRGYQSEINKVLRNYFIASTSK